MLISSCGWFCREQIWTFRDSNRNTSPSFSLYHYLLVIVCVCVCVCVTSQQPWLLGDLRCECRAFCEQQFPLRNVFSTLFLSSEAPGEHFRPEWDSWVILQSRFSFRHTAEAAADETLHNHAAKRRRNVTKSVYSRPVLQQHSDGLISDVEVVILSSQPIRNWFFPPWSQLA